ncbi:hypothetical protein YC2023_017301 [Brassica napus]
MHRIGYCPAGHSHGYLMLGYSSVGSCYCPAGSYILDSRRPPVLGGPNRISSKFINTFTFSFPLSFSFSFTFPYSFTLRLVFTH